MNLKHILVISLIALSSMFPKVLAQTVSGTITNLFTNQPVPGAVVSVEGISPDGVTNEEGFYVAGDTTSSVEFPYVITPVKTDKFKIYNNNGQLVRNLENITNNSIWDLRNNQGIPVATGIYF